MLHLFKDPVSGLLHLGGALLGAFGFCYLVSRSYAQGGIEHAIPFGVFGLSLVLLYSSSALYHLPHVSEKNRLTLRRIDHSMIFVLIAGTYTPFCMGPLAGKLGTSILILEWVIALFGFFFSVFWIHAPRWLSTSLYLAMGWVALGAIYPLSQALTSAALFWVVAGGLFYTFGAVIYWKKKPDPFPPYFGFHEIWHLFVLAGSTSHFIAVASLV